MIPYGYKKTKSHPNIAGLVEADQLDKSVRRLKKRARREAKKETKQELK